MLDVLRCPREKGVLEHREAADVFVCEECGTEYPRRGGVVRFVGGDEYVGNFSFEWQTHARTQLDDEARRTSEQTFREKTGWSEDDLRGKRVLDVGCGMGRFSDVALRWGAEVYAMDLSFGVDAAQANLGDRPLFHALQASVFEPPFSDGSFDLIFSLGVLDHTPDCERAFKGLPRLLKPGGRIAIWVYSLHGYRPDSVDEKRDRLYRRYAMRMRPERLHRLLRILCRVPVKRRGLWHMLLPGAIFHAIPRLHGEYPNLDDRVLDSFDWYSPQYQSKHSYPEVCRWFRETGLIDVEPLDVEVAVRGVRPQP